MQQIKIPKRGGGHRLIYVPSTQEKRVLRPLGRKVEALVRRLSPPNVLHGFVFGKSPVTNAEQHIGFKYTLCFDLKDFFDSVRKGHVAEYLQDRNVFPEDVLDLLFVDGAPRQGLPSSPPVANLAALKMDEAILAGIGTLRRIAYTRYADDLSISFSNKAYVKFLRETIPIIVAHHGFTINDRKTRLQWSGAGRRIITGVAVDDTNVYPTRAVRRRLRAARHQQNHAQASGLAEWCKLKPPRGFRVIRDHQKRTITIIALAPWRQAGEYKYASRKEQQVLPEIIAFLQSRLTQVTDPDPWQVFQELRPGVVEKTLLKATHQ